MQAQQGLNIAAGVAALQLRADYVAGSAASEPLAGTPTASCDSSSCLADMDAAAVVRRAAFDQALPWLAGLHTPEEDRQFFRSACSGPARSGARPTGGSSHHRLPRGLDRSALRAADGQRRGIGTGLLDVARSKFARLQLWTFQRNAQARRFYEARGFVLVEETDGSRNEEREPDARYLWSRDGA